jgi:hypothetical protein
MPVFRMPNEYALFVKPTFAHPPGLVTLSNQGPFEYVLHPPARADLLPTTVVYGDSFFDGITRAGFDVYFQDLYRARVGYGLKLSGIVRSLPADARYLVIQFIEVTGAVLVAFADKADLALATKMIEDRR